MICRSRAAPASAASRRPSPAPPVHWFSGRSREKPHRRNSRCHPVRTGVAACSPGPLDRQSSGAPYTPNARVGAPRLRRHAAQPPTCGTRWSALPLKGLRLPLRRHAPAAASGPDRPAACVGCVVGTWSGTSPPAPRGIPDRQDTAHALAHGLRTRPRVRRAPPARYGYARRRGGTQPRKTPPLG
jgi:hypothetical protein